METTWRKASRSADQSNCVEIRSDLAAVRDSKNPEATLVLRATSVAALVSTCRE